MIRTLIYGGLGVEAFRLAGGAAAGAGEAELWTARVMDLPLAPGWSGWPGPQ